MNSIIFFSSILIATFAIETCTSERVHAYDSFYPLNGRDTSSSRRNSQRSSRNSRSNGGLKNVDRKLDSIDLVNQANPTNPQAYMNADAGGVQQPTTLQDSSINQGNDAMAFYYNGNNQQQRQRSQFRTNRASYPSRSMTRATTLGSHPLNVINPSLSSQQQTLVPVSSLTHQQVVPTTTTTTTGHVIVSNPSTGGQYPMVASQYPSALVQSQGIGQHNVAGQHVNLVQSHSTVYVPATVVHTTPVQTYATIAQQHPVQQHIFVH